MSSTMLFACSGNKQQSSDATNTDNAVETRVTAEADAEKTELLWGYISIDNDHLDPIENVDREEFYRAQEFLMDVVYYNENVDTYSEEWITAHCTPEVKQFLRDKYDFDGEGYAKWLFEGEFAGEGEYDNQVVGFGYGLRRGKPVYSVEKQYSFQEELQLTRTLYFGLQRNGEDFIITSFEINLESKDPTVNNEVE